MGTFAIIEDDGGYLPKGLVEEVRLLAAVKARKSACKVLEMPSKVERITAKQAQKMMENPAPMLILRQLKRLI